MFEGTAFLRLTGTKWAPLFLGSNTAVELQALQLGRRIDPVHKSGY